jgi:hypothetical protein
MGDKIEPLLPKWTAAKGKSPALSNGSLRPDIVPAIKKYDQAGTDYEKLMKEKDKLPEILKALDAKLKALGVKYDKLVQQRDSAQEEDNEKFTQYSGELDSYLGNKDADPSAVVRTLTGFIEAGTHYTGMTTTLNGQLAKFDQEAIAMVKKARDEYKSKNAAIEAGEKKIEASGDAAESQIRSIALSYEKTVAKQGDDAAAKAVREFVKALN